LDFLEEDAARLVQDVEEDFFDSVSSELSAMLSLLLLL
jgi:hypothetical protein